MLKLAVPPGVTVRFVGFVRTAGSPPVTTDQLVPIRKSSMTPLGAVAFWHRITNPCTKPPPDVLMSPVNVPITVGTETVGGGGALDPRVAPGGLIHILTFVTPPMRSYDPTTKTMSFTLNTVVS